MADIFREKCELLKARGEELQRNFLSLRVVEWRIAFQSYIGYGFVAAAYNVLKSNMTDPCWLSVGMTVVSAILYFTSLYFSIRLQERLHYLHNAGNRYFDALHRKLKVPKLELAEDGPIHPRWYAFIAFQLIHISVYFALLTYIALTSKSAIAVTLAIAAVPLPSSYLS